MANYYIWRNGRQEGPFDTQTIICMNLSGDTLVWCEGMSNWTPISQVPELQQAYQVVPPPFTHNVPPQFPNQGPPQYGQEYQQQNDYQQQYSEYEENKKEFFKELLKILACLVIVGLVFLYKCSGDSNTTDDADVQVTEQTQESEYQESISEQTEESETVRQENEKQEKVNKVAEIAYKEGYEKRMSTRELIGSESSAHMEYTIRYGKEPEEEQSQERWNIYLENYKKGFSDAADKLKEKMNSEDF